jgi:ribosome biogenesis GTPase
MQGRIIKSLSGFYYVLTEDKVIQCRGRGVFRKNNITPLVGDHVVFEAENDDEGYILEIKERKNELIRPPISNVDQAILVFSAVEPEFNPLLLDRFLVLIEEIQIKPVICISKMDLVGGKKLKEVQSYIEAYKQIGYDVLETSVISSDGIETLRPFLKDQISVFAGQSGVGKSSLLNAINPELQLKTDDISTHLGRGKHTTRHVELIRFGAGLVADTPGFSSLEFMTIEAEDLALYFPEIREAAPGCKFRGCLHLKEPKCAVKASVDENKIPQFRYDHYVSFMEEIKERKPRY